MQHLSSNGYFETKKLFETPFTEVSAQGLLGVFNSTQADEVVSMLERVNRYAEAG
jgi:type I restriction enzyme R subunit